MDLGRITIDANDFMQWIDDTHGADTAVKIKVSPVNWPMFIDMYANPSLPSSLRVRLGRHQWFADDMVGRAQAIICGVDGKWRSINMATLAPYWD